MYSTSPRNTFLGMFVLVTILAIFSGIAHASAPRLIEDKSCTIVTVASGDNAWTLAGANDITLDVLAKLNPQIPDLSKIYPSDELAIGCGKPKPNAFFVQKSVTVTEPGDWAQWRNTTEPCLSHGQTLTCWTWQAIVIALHDVGFRGNDLITMAAITPGESNRVVVAVGDQHLQDDKWGPSVGVFQIRTLWKEQGKGTTRDINRLNTLAGSAASAHDLYESSKERRNNGEMITPVGKTEKRQREAFDDWTCYQIGNHLGQIETVRTIASQMGALS